MLCGCPRPPRHSVCRVNSARCRAAIGVAAIQLVGAARADILRRPPMGAVVRDGVGGLMSPGKSSLRPLHSCNSRGGACNQFRQRAVIPPGLL
jgi:hypothetical protein